MATERASLTKASDEAEWSQLQQELQDNDEIFYWLEELVFKK